MPQAVAARVVQIAMMATFREAPEELLEWVTRLLGELYRAKRFEEVAKHVMCEILPQPTMATSTAAANASASWHRRR